MSKSFKPFTPTVKTGQCPPQRTTGPRSCWRDILNGMRPGEWFETPAFARFRVLTAAQKYCRGRYSFYQHPTKDEAYIFVRIK
jgi:hypothetical protein